MTAGRQFREHAAMDIAVAQAQAIDPPNQDTAVTEQATCPADEASWLCALNKFGVHIRDNLDTEAKGTSGLVGVSTLAFAVPTQRQAGFRGAVSVSTTPRKRASLRSKLQESRSCSSRHA